MSEFWLWITGGGLTVAVAIIGIYRHETAAIAKEKAAEALAKWEAEHEKRLAEMISLAVQTGIGPLRESLMAHEGDEDAHPLMVRSWERRRDDRLHEVLKTLNETLRLTVIQAFADALKLHNEDPRAHPAADEKNRGPIAEKLDRLDREVMRLREAHNLAAGSGKHYPVKDEG